MGCHQQCGPHQKELRLLCTTLVSPITTATLCLKLVILKTIRLSIHIARIKVTNDIRKLDMWLKRVEMVFNNVHCVPRRNLDYSIHNLIWMNSTYIPIHIHFTTNITQLTNYFFMMTSPRQHNSLCILRFEQLFLDQNMQTLLYIKFILCYKS